MAKRILALGVVLAVCSGIAGAVSAATPAQTTSANRRAAIAAAGQLVSSVVLPSGATQIPAEPTGDARELAQPMIRLFFAAQVDRHGFWTTGASAAAVIASVKGHLPPGAKSLGSGYTGSSQFASYTLPTTDPAVLRTRQLVIATVVLPDGSTAVRVDAEVRYLAPRLADQQVPPEARVLDITMTTGAGKPLLARTFTRRSQVRGVATLVNGLPFAGNLSGVAFSCPAYPSDTPLDTFTFRSTVGGRVLAKVSELATTPTSVDPCAVTQLVVRGHHEPGLMNGGTLLRRTGALLGVKLTASH